MDVSTLWVIEVETSNRDTTDKNCSHYIEPGTEEFRNTKSVGHIIWKPTSMLLSPVIKLNHLNYDKSARLCFLNECISAGWHFILTEVAF